MKSSRHEAAAQRLLGFLVSAKAQEIIAHWISFRVPDDRMRLLLVRTSSAYC